MADAFCGPSNALQNFKRHTQVDRSLQQDRLTGPRAIAPGFRTQDPRAGSLDADFEAFENATANPFQEPFVGNTFPTQLPFQQPIPADWATDFQQLAISDQPVPAQQFRDYAPLVKSTNGGWQNEFMRQQSSGLSSVAQGKQIVLDQQNVPVSLPPVYLENVFSGLSPTGPRIEKLVAQKLHQVQLDSMAGAGWSQAFEEAFQDAFKDAEQDQTAGYAREASLPQEGKSYEQDVPENIQQIEQVRIGSDAIDYTEKKDRTADQETLDASALARVAGELLHNVQHDSSEKFQNSQFLDLMRKIRDRQIEVRNNDFQSTAPGESETTVHPIQASTSVTDQDIRSAPDPIQDQSTFSFPDMNAIYNPRQADFGEYSFDSSDQIADLHPGGRYYPEQSPPITGYAQMTGALSPSTGEGPSSRISADDFEAVYDESWELAGRYQRTAA